MNTVQLIAYGDKNIVLRDVDEPSQPGAGEVLVQVRFAPINFNDLMVAWGVYDWKPDLPEVLGNEGAGVVLAIGEGVTDLHPGTPVVLPFMARSWRERMVVSAKELIPLPPDADLQQAAMATINAVTAALLLDVYVNLQPGDAVIYNAASSGLGHWIAGLASRRGLRTIGLVRKPKDVAQVRASSGCDIVLVDEDGLSADDPRIVGLKIRLALDGVGGASAGRLAALLSLDGVLVAYGAASHEPMHISAQHLIFKRISVCGFFEGHPKHRAKIPETLTGLVDLLRPGGIQQPVAAVYPVTAIETAVEHAVKGGKVLLEFGALE
ncbi:MULTISPECIES: zinc-dependent alcohol dehydrogenase family protein [unclassified Caballeronia]|uniref:zinc-dependent alcohol dehydrogenase family protein n=1 Tax=unclassified Caballeronia TaxID=2646786 RepID=UPI002028A62D|nr:MULTISPECIES: zinc-dependent alcohol dehydrogenase family protein [unclassified Caballeronia]